MTLAMSAETPPDLVDTHCHLNHPRFEADAAAVVERAHAAGVRRMLLVGYDLPSSRQAVAMADPDQGLYAAVGIHPHAASEWCGAAEAELRGMLAAPAVLAVGEIGLDFFRNLSPVAHQEEAFRAQLLLAAELGLPFVTHTRESVPEALDLLEATLGSSIRGVMHCWSGTPEQAERAIGLGLHLGFGGSVTYPGNDQVRRALRESPVGRVLLETDSPYLAPLPLRGRRNEPAFLTHVLARVALERGESAAAVAAATSAAAGRLFGWPEPAPAL